MPEKWQVKVLAEVAVVVAVGNGVNNKSEIFSKEVGNTYNSTHFRKNMYTNGRPASGGGRDVLVVSNYTLLVLCCGVLAPRSQIFSLTFGGIIKDVISTGTLSEHC